MTFGAAAVTTNGAAEQLLQLVGVPRPGEVRKSLCRVCISHLTVLKPVVFETTAAVGLISVFGAASLHNITVRHRYVRAAEDRSALCAICTPLSEICPAERLTGITDVRGSLILENCEISAGAKAVYAYETRLLAILC